MSNNLQSLNEISEEIKTLMMEARVSATREINNQLLKTYWNIGRIIVEYEQNGNLKAEYGSKLLTELSKELTPQLGRGFSRSNLANMRLFYLLYPKIQTLSGQLAWSHYCELLSIKNDEERSFYEKEATHSAWSVRELKRQINTSLFERLLLSSGKNNKETVLSLAREGIAMEKAEVYCPADILANYLPKFPSAALSSIGVAYGYASILRLAA